jgi:hypothetical protein
MRVRLWPPSGCGRGSRRPIYETDKGAAKKSTSAFAPSKWPGRGNTGIGSRLNSLSALMRGTSKRADGKTAAPGENGLTSSAEKRRTCVCFKDRPGGCAANLLTRDEARRMAANVAKLVAQALRIIGFPSKMDIEETTMRFKPKSMDELRTCVGPCSPGMHVEIERGVPIAAQTVAHLRSLTNWPPHLVLVVHRDSDPRFSSVRLEWA